MCINPTICIPRCEDNYLKILNTTFSKFGYIKNIQIYNLKVIIKYKYWYPQYFDIVKRLNEKKNVNIVYDFPLYWRCFKYHPQ